MSSDTTTHHQEQKQIARDESYNHSHEVEFDAPSSSAEFPNAYAVYVMANSILTFSVDLTDNLLQAVEFCKSNADPFAFTTRFSLHTLLYYELYSSENSARNRLSKLRGMSKNELIALTKKMNPTMSDILPNLLDGNTPQIHEKELKGKRQQRRKKKNTSYATVYSLRGLSSSSDS